MGPCSATLPVYGEGGGFVSTLPPPWAPWWIERSARRLKDMSKPTTVKEYLASLDPERKKAIEAVRKVIKANLDPKIKEVLSYGMLGYCIPHSEYPYGYHCNPDQPLPFINLASQKAHMAVYLFCIYGNDKEIARFEADWKKTGKKLNMGKACLRFKKLEDLDLAVLGRAIKRMTAAKFIKEYEAALEGTAAGKKLAAKKAKEAGAQPAAKKAAKKVSKKAPAKKAAAKKASPKKKAAPKKATAKKGTKKKAAKKTATRRKSS